MPVVRRARHLVRREMRELRRRAPRLPRGGAGPAGVRGKLAVRRAIAFSGKRAGGADAGLCVAVGDMIRNIICVVALAALGTAWVHAAVPVEGLTAEKVGIPAEDFVTPEEAKEVAVKYFNDFGGVIELASESQTLILPWVIEDWNKYEPEIFMGYYEITVFNGTNRFESYEELEKIISDYVTRFVPEITVAGNELRFPRELETREDLTPELFGDADVRTYWVRINRVWPAVIEPVYDTAIGCDFVTPEIGRQTLQRLFGFDSPVFERSILFGLINGFNVYDVDGKKVYLQFMDKKNRTRFFIDAERFNEYFEAKRSVVDTEQLRKRKRYDPFEW